MENYIPTKGDVFKWCDEEYICIESNSHSGLVNPIGETYYIRNFLWSYENEPQEFIRRLTEEEFNNMFGELKT